MTEDPIVAEIRKIRHAHAAKFNNDIAAICADVRRQQKESGREYVTLPPRRPASKNGLVAVPENSLFNSQGK